MEKEDRKRLEENVEKAAYDSMSDPNYWAKRRSHWDEWGSPIGLGLAWALLIIPAGVFLWLIHLAGMI
jgi:hypothetical protein